MAVVTVPLLRRSGLPERRAPSSAALRAGAAAVAPHGVPLQAHGIAILEEAATRSPAACQVTKPLVCHGAAGLAHLFNRAWQSSGSDGLRAGAIRWFERLLAMQSDQEGFAGFSSSIWQGDRGERVGHPGLLEGASGIGIASSPGPASPTRTGIEPFLLS